MKTINEINFYQFGYQESKININILFSIIITSLVLIFIGFKPLKVKQQNFVDIPLFELQSFVVYEINQLGLDTMILGSNAIRYSDRYRVKNIDYTDNSRDYIVNMKANNGIYKNNIVVLNGNVVYTREDGVTFQTKKVIYNKKTSIAKTDTPYILYQGQNRVIGSSLIYNSKLNTIQSNQIVAKYQLKEKDDEI